MYLYGEILTQILLHLDINKRTKISRTELPRLSFFMKTMLQCAFFKRLNVAEIV